MTALPATVVDPGDQAGPLIYHGAYLIQPPHGHADGVIWLEREALPGVHVGRLHHRTGTHSHSPTGFGWGYTGSGPAETAHAILTDAVRSTGTATCPTCAGAARIVLAATDDDTQPYDPVRHAAVPDDEVHRCWDCDGTGLRFLPYQQFKSEHVAQWGATWSMPRADVITWWRAWWQAHPEAATEGGA